MVFVIVGRTRWGDGVMVVVDVSSTGCDDGVSGGRR